MGRWPSPPDEQFIVSTANTCPTRGAKNHPDRLPMNYREHGTRQFHGCHSVGDDTMWGAIRALKSAVNTSPRSNRLAQAARSRAREVAIAEKGMALSVATEANGSAQPHLMPHRAYRVPGEAMRCCTLPHRIRPRPLRLPRWAWVNCPHGPALPRP